MGARHPDYATIVADCQGGEGPDSVAPGVHARPLLNTDVLAIMPLFPLLAMADLTVDESFDGLRAPPVRLHEFGAGAPTESTGLITCYAAGGWIA